MILLVVLLSTGWMVIEKVVVKQGEYVTVRNAVTGERRVINTPGEFELSDDETLERYGPAYEAAPPVLHAPVVWSLTSVAGVCQALRVRSSSLMSSTSS